MTVARAPRGWRRILWLGPGFLWMVSAAGSGELLFTPRVGALHGYTLLWAMLIVTALPIGLYLVLSEPVELLKIAGAIEAAHIPIVTALTLYLNRTHVPAALRPSILTAGATAVAGLFFAVFAIYYVAQLVTAGS